MVPLHGDCNVHPSTHAQDEGEKRNFVHRRPHMMDAKAHTDARAIPRTQSGSLARCFMKASPA